MLNLFHTSEAKWLIKTEISLSQTSNCRYVQQSVNSNNKKFAKNVANLQTVITWIGTLKKKTISLTWIKFIEGRKLEMNTIANYSRDDEQ